MSIAAEDALRPGFWRKRDEFGELHLFQITEDGKVFELKTTEEDEKMREGLYDENDVFVSEADGPTGTGPGNDG